jgi:hypothetical protein
MAGNPRIEGRAVYFAATPENPVGLRRHSEKEAPEQISDAEENEDDRGDDGGDERHHRKQFRAGSSVHGGNYYE